jgi:hypothetical protein
MNSGLEHDRSTSTNEMIVSERPNASGNSDAVDVVPFQDQRYLAGLMTVRKQRQKIGKSGMTSFIDGN